MWQGGWMSLRLRDLQQVLSKFSDGNKGTAISDCFVYMENDQGGLNEIGRIELQESRLIGKINSSAAWLYLKKIGRRLGCSRQRLKYDGIPWVRGESESGNPVIL